MQTTGNCNHTVCGEAKDMQLQTCTVSGLASWRLLEYNSNNFHHLPMFMMLSVSGL